jgi:hypothetical protein
MSAVSRWRALVIVLVAITVISVAVLSSESMLLRRGMNSNAVLPSSDASLRRELADLSVLVAQLNAKLDSSVASSLHGVSTAPTLAPSADATTCTFAQHQQQRNDAAEIKRKLDSLLSRQTGTAETPVCPIAKRCDSNRLVVVRRPEAAADCADDDREWATRYLLPPPSPSLSTLPIGGATRLNETRLRVVFLLPAAKDVFMDRWFHQMAAAAMRNERIDASLWGEGREGWNASLSLAANLLARFDGPVDVVHMWWRHTLGGGGSPLAAGACRVLSTTYHEIYCANRTIGRCGVHRALDQVNVAFFAYANTVPWALENLRADQLYIHEPHGAERALFEHRVDALRDIDVLLAGRVEYFYPLRTKFYDLAVAGSDPPITVRVHPTYALENASAAEAQAADYAAQLKRAKIVLVCRSTRNFALRKYVEAAMAGALVVGDVPDERMSEFRSWLVEARVDESDAALLERLRWWLAHRTEREARARRGQRLMAALYTYDAVVDRMVDGWVAYIDGGQRGVQQRYEYVLNPLTNDLNSNVAPRTRRTQR